MIDFKKLNIDALKSVFDKKKYSFFENGDWNLNCIFVRVSDKLTNQYTDYAINCYKINGKWQLSVYPASTKAGKYWVENPNTYKGIKGVAIVVPNQYRATWEFVDSYNLSHKCPHLNQIAGKNVQCWRDGDKDGFIDKVNLQNIPDSINSHCGGNKLQVHNWSAGCMVVPKYGGNYLKWIDEIRTSSEKYGDIFTITLLELSDFI